MIPKKIKIAFDFKKQLYYGEKDNPHIIGILAEKGTKKALKWHIYGVIKILNLMNKKISIEQANYGIYW